jgi:hypothetical protein
MLAALFRHSWSGAYWFPIARGLRCGWCSPPRWLRDGCRGCSLKEPILSREASLLPSTFFDAVFLSPMPESAPDSQSRGSTIKLSQCVEFPWQATAWVSRLESGGRRAQRTEAPDSPDPRPRDGMAWSPGLGGGMRACNGARMKKFDERAGNVYENKQSRS